MTARVRVFMHRRGAWQVHTCPTHDPVSVVEIVVRLLITEEEDYPYLSVESNARDHVTAFCWWVGTPEMSLAEAEWRDLAALRDAMEAEIAMHANAVTTYEEVSWTVVADALSLTPTAARRRYGR